MKLLMSLNEPCLEWIEDGAYEDMKDECESCGGLR